MSTAVPPDNRAGGGRVRRPLLLVLAGLLSASAISVVTAGSANAALPGCLAGEIVDVAPTPSGAGYTLVGSDGGIFNFGDSRFFGSMGGKPLNKPVVSVVPTASGNGYWEVAADGGVFAFGDAVAPSSNPLPGKALNSPVVEATRIGTNGLLLVAGDGGVFALGGAPFLGSMGGKPLNKPMVDIVASPSGNGYATVAADGGIFAFGDFQGPGNNPLPGMAARGELKAPVTAAARYGTGFGLILAGGDGGTFALGGAPFIGSAANLTLAKPVTGIALAPTGNGQWLAGADGGAFAYGSAGFFGNAVSNSNCATTPAPTNGTTSAKIVATATDILNGRAVSPSAGGVIHYSWGGGHGRTFGPSVGTCDRSYTGPTPCKADHTVGVDCSGFSRWVYAIAYGTDVFGGVNTDGQLGRMHSVSSPQPGDLVFFSPTGRPSGTTHVGIYVGGGQMIESPHTNADVRKSAVSGHPGLAGYYRY